jgi:4-amino-4-deoxy-L-arabinose transferase-like glycosyltransferase
MTDNGLRGRLRSIDPLTGVVGVVATLTYVLHGFNGYLSRDLAIYSYAGQQALDGVPPYVSVLNRAGPLAQLIPAAGAAVARLGGFDDLLGIRLLFMCIAVACVCVAYLLGRDVFRSAGAGVATAAALLSFAGFIEFATNGPREKTPMVLFMLLALWAMARRRWFATGIYVALATLILQIAFFVLAPAALVAALGAGPRRRLRALLRIAAGGLVPVAGFVAYFWSAGALRQFVDGFLLINARYTTVSRPDFGHDWNRLRAGYGPSLWMLLVGLVAVVFLFLPVLRERGRRDPAVPTLVGLAAACVFGIAWTVRDFDSWPDAFPLLPLAAVGAGGLVWELARRLPRQAAMATVLAWAVAAGALAVTFSIGQRDHTLPAQRAAVASVLSQLPPDATVLSIQAPQPLVLSGKTNPTRYQMFASGLDRYVDDTWPGGLKGFAGWIKREQPTLVAIGQPRTDRWAGMLRPDYKRLGCAPGWTWFAHESLGPDALTQLQRRVHRQAARTVNAKCQPLRGKPE